LEFAAGVEENAAVRTRASESKQKADWIASATGNDMQHAWVYELSAYMDLFVIYE
jgi:hypothetical protein